MKILTKNSDPLILAAVVVPHICDAIHVPPITATGAYEHLDGLELEDSGDLSGELEIGKLPEQVLSHQTWLCSRCSSYRFLSGELEIGKLPEQVLSHQTWLCSRCSSYRFPEDITDIQIGSNIPTLLKQVLLKVNC